MRGGPAEEAELEEEISPSRQALPSDMTLEKIVQLPTWREILLELVHANQLDPWNIDVVDIATQYLERVKKLETDDLRLPANLILGAAILLRFKSDALQLEEPPEQALLDEFVDDTGPVEIPTLELRGRIPPKRRVSLDELLEAMEKVMEDSRKHETVMKQVKLSPNMEIKLTAINIEEKMKEVLGKIGERTDSSGWATFSGLLDGDRGRAGIIYTLLPLLHLTQEGKVFMMQEKFFGEIFVRLGGKGG